MDYESGTVIFQKDADAQLEPASMAKLMSLAVVFNEIRSGRVHLNDEFFVSEHAWRTGGASSGGSTMFA
ncbi:MAG: D-alanyl-D-alanine carboxypeptidase, partial [Caulobacteraceae bacterium]